MGTRDCLESLENFTYTQEGVLNIRKKVQRLVGEILLSRNQSFVILYQDLEKNYKFLKGVVSEKQEIVNQNKAKLHQLGAEFANVKSTMLVE